MLFAYTHVVHVVSCSIKKSGQVKLLIDSVSKSVCLSLQLNPSILGQLYIYTYCIILAYIFPRYQCQRSLRDQLTSKCNLRNYCYFFPCYFLMIVGYMIAVSGDQQTGKSLSVHAQRDLILLHFVCVSVTIYHAGATPLACRLKVRYQLIANGDF